MKAIPENTMVRVTIKHEAGEFVGKKVETIFILEDGGVWSGYWEDKIETWVVDAVDNA